MILTLLDNFERFQTSVEGRTEDSCSGKSGELELEVKPEDVTELLPSHDKTLTDEQLLLRDEQKK